MSLTCRLDTGEILDARNYNPEIHKGKIYDKFTESECVWVPGHDRKYKTGRVRQVRSHFRSRYIGDFPSALEFSNEYFLGDGTKYSPGESEEHREGKRWIAEYYITSNPGYLLEEILELEYLVKLPTGKWRICDVAFVFPSGEVEVFECQLSPITPEELQARSEDYRYLGFNFDWIFGKRAVTQSNIEWYYNYFGFYPATLKIETDTEEDSEE